MFSQNPSLTFKLNVVENYPEWVDVHVAVYGFSDMLTMQYALAYDQDEVSFSGATGFNLTGLTSTNIGNPPGYVLLSWLAADIVTGETVPDGTVIYTLRFIPTEQGACFLTHSPIIPIPTEITDVNGWVFAEFVDCNAPGLLSGKVFFDENEDCSLSSGEPALPWFVVEVASNGQTHYVPVNANGEYYYFIKPDDEMLEVGIIPPNELWAACAPAEVVEIEPGVNLYALDLGAAPLADCPRAAIEIAAPFLRRCFPGNYYVSYCNLGTLPVVGAEAVVEFDPFLEISGSTLPWSSVSGNTYVFPLGDIGVGECGVFQVSFTVSCDALLGQTHCTEATILPVEYCDPLPSWSGAQLIVSGGCDGEEVLFEIRNAGQGGMDEPSGYIVIEDDMIKMIEPIAPLGPGDWVEIPLPANGSTWRVEAAQVPAFPFQSEPSATVEACDGSGGGDISLGYAGMFSQDENAPHVAIDCQENIGSFDPNDKTAFPKGYRELHLIEPDVRLEYRIRFQNTGTDTAFKVVIVDTLSALLDPASLRLQAWSHPCELQILDDRRLIVDFPGILLPDSTTNEEASNGFVQFSIAQMPGNPLGEVIENRAAIYFDFNDPIITNEVFHTLGVDFIQDVSSVSQAPAPMSRLVVSPNPASEAFTVSMPDPAAQGASLQIYDANGRLARSLPWNAASLLVSREGLPPGLYWLALDAGGKTLAVGVVVVE